LQAYRLDLYSTALRVVYDRGRRVKTHWLMIEHTGVKFRGAMHFQIRAPVGQDRKTDRVRFRKPIKRERRDRMNDLVDFVLRHILSLHRGAQFYAYLLHSFLRAMKTQS